MEDGDAPPTIISIPKSAAAAVADTITTTPPAAAAKKKKESPDCGTLLGKSPYKFWALSAVILLALWTMFTGSVTLKWSTGGFTHVSDDPNFQAQYDDLDILELEEKEKVVKRMWELYTQSSSSNNLPRFWQEAFEAAYESLASDVPAARDAAVSEIAKISIRSLDLDPLSHQSTATNATEAEQTQSNEKKARYSGQ